MVWAPILMECSVTEDSSLGGGGVGSPGFSFSTVLVSFSCVRSWAGAPNGGRPSSAAAAMTLRRKRFGILSAPKANLGKTRRPFANDVLGKRVYTPRESEVKEARIVGKWQVKAR